MRLREEVVGVRGELRLIDVAITVAEDRQIDAIGGIAGRLQHLDGVAVDAWCEPVADATGQ